jgi:glycosyltransferase involved in cell wall biosynthesis
LAALQQEGCQVIVVSSTTIQGDADVERRLVETGCFVWNRYVEAIQEVYALADCYAFPMPAGVGAIEHPLSIMEAMACNLPVVTRRFGALPRVFEPGDGLYFVDSDDELKNVVQRIQDAREGVATWRKVHDLDWDAIAARIVALYRGMIAGRQFEVARESVVSQRE